MNQLKKPKTNFQIL